MQDYLGFLGLGHMGLPLALRLLRATSGEMDLRVFDLQAERMTPLLARGAYRAATAAETARRGGIVFSMLPDDQTLLHVALDPQGLLKQLGTGGVHVSLSIGSPEVAAHIASQYRQRGCAYLMAATLGQPVDVPQGTVSLFLAGEPAAKTRVRSLLERMSEQIYDLGDQVEEVTLPSILSVFLLASAMEGLTKAMETLRSGDGPANHSFLQLLVEALL